VEPRGKEEAFVEVKRKEETQGMKEESLGLSSAYGQKAESCKVINILA